MIFIIITFHLQILFTFMGFIFLNTFQLVLLYAQIDSRIRTFLHIIRVNYLSYSIKAKIFLKLYEGYISKYLKYNSVFP